MDDFPDLLARDFGFRPQGKSTPMSAAPGGARSGGWGSADSLFGAGISGDSSPPGYDDVFAAAPPRSTSSNNFDSIFGDPKSSSHMPPPAHDKPVYDDDDIFDGVPGVVKNPAASADYEDVFAAMSAGSNKTSSSPPYDDIFENLGRTMPRGSGDQRSGELKGQDSSVFEDLLPGFGSSRPPQQREPPETERQPAAASSAKPTADDPFVVLEATSTSGYPSSVLFTDPLEQNNRHMDSGSSNNTHPVSEGLFDDEELTKSEPLFTSKINDNPMDINSLMTEKEPSQRSSRESLENITPRMQPTKSSDSLNTNGRTGVNNFDTSYNPYERNGMADQSPKLSEHLETADDVWLTVDEITLFTQPTSGPPPSRPPPPVAIRQTSSGKLDPFLFTGVNSKARDIGSSQSTHTYQHMKNSSASTIDELEDFASGKPQSYFGEHAEVSIGEEKIKTNSAAAAMKEAMDRAEAKFKHAREVMERERDAKSAKNRESAQKEIYENATADAQYPEEDEEKQDRLVREREQREMDEKEQQKRRERQREQELERERARQAVNRATREARERAAAEARLKAERAAVEKANAEARQRAGQAAFQKVSAEARERAAADAREREREQVAAEAKERERAAAEAREKERVATETRERERISARDRVAVEKVAQEARIRAQRAAVEKVTAEARERAAAEAQRRAAAEAQERATAEAHRRAAATASAAAPTRERQQKAENDLDNLFNIGARPSSAPKQRNPTSEASFDTQFQNKGFSGGVQRTSSGTSSTIRKAQSTINIVDDLAAIFGAPTSSGEFQEVEGETEERRRARLERHQRTLQRTAQALSEKNERDMKVQREQAERNRIGETLDFEIKRWSVGKEGNLRALLSTLQYVLWPECGWQPVSLTDLINGASVKKAYRKATLCIHPDKVQQKGATLQQKYIAEKVFDLLKEAWNKFNSEELF